MKDCLLKHAVLFLHYNDNRVWQIDENRQYPNNKEYYFRSEFRRLKL